MNSFMAARVALKPANPMAIKLFFSGSCLPYTDDRPTSFAIWEMGLRGGFQAVVKWDGAEVEHNDISGSRGVGDWDITTDGGHYTGFDKIGVVRDQMREWLQNFQDYELWVLSLQYSWRMLNHLGLHSGPVYDVSTYARLVGSNFGEACRDGEEQAIGKLGHGRIVRFGAYSSIFTFKNIRSYATSTAYQS